MISTVRRAVRLVATDPAAARHRLRMKSVMLRHRWANRLRRSRVTGDAPVVLNLTTFGGRTERVFYTLESIASGTVRPRRLILWIDEQATLDAPPATLRRLQRRGLEILPCENHGSHKKQYAYATSGRAEGLPLAVADDDVFYPPTWLAGLLEAHRRHPEAINGYRAHTVAVTGGRIAPYDEWTPCTTSEPSYATFLTGVSGIIYPPALLDALAQEGTAFREVAPTADDVWVHAVGVRAGIPSRQVSARQAEFPAVPGTQDGTLYRINVKEGRNDVQIQRAYGPEEVARIARAAAEGGPSPRPAGDEPGREPA